METSGSTGPTNDPVLQQLQLLLSGYGYNFYNTENRMRADDLLVRERASYFLSQAADVLATLQGAYSRRFIPPLTRANPEPPQEALAQVREITDVRQEISNVESHVRGMSVPTQDRIWWRIRNERMLLGQLMQFDLGLVSASEQLYAYVEQLTPEMWNSQGSGQLRQLIQRVRQQGQARERFLLMPL